MFCCCIYNLHLLAVLTKYEYRPVCEITGTHGLVCVRKTFKLVKMFPIIKTKWIRFNKSYSVG